MIQDMTQSPAVSTGQGDPVDERISAAVRGLMAQRRSAPPQVALAVGISRSAFFYKLACERPWKAYEVERLAGYFAVSRDSLYEGRADFVAAPGTVTAASAPVAQRIEHLTTDHESHCSRRLRGRRASDRRRRLGVLPLYLRQESGRPLLRLVRDEDFAA